MKIVFSKSCLGYEMRGHPESPKRVERVKRILTEQGFEFIEPEPIREEDTSKVHSPSLIESIKNGNFYDPDTPYFPGIYSHALLSAAGAVKAMEIALSGEFAFSLMRPPGHHATKERVGGFCYLNNIAIATSKAMERVKKVTIVDIDCHHGNGTQDIFLGDERVLYISLHQSPLYPGTGLTSTKNCLNFPLPPGTGEKEYIRVLEGALRKVEEFNPDLLAISAGFDTYKGDPLTQITLETKSYLKIASMLKALKRPSFVVLEGGYSLDLPLCVLEFLKGWMDEDHSSGI
jgi:acetoin utilization deacetylase AcuC-like enzyme